MDVYYIPQLHSSIISIGQLDERGSEVLIKDGVLRIRDREQQLLAKVKRSQNRLYLAAGVPGGKAHRGTMVVACPVRTSQLRRAWSTREDGPRASPHRVRR